LAKKYISKIFQKNVKNYIGIFKLTRSDIIY